MPPHAAGSRRTHPRRHTLRWLLIGALVLILFWVAWVGLRAIMAKVELEKSVSLATILQTQITNDDARAAKATAGQLAKHARSAQDLTSDPLWRAAELLPLAGPNLAAVREVSAILSSVTDEAVVPLADVVGSIDVAAFKPVDGAVNTAPLVSAQPTVARASDALTKAVADARAIRTGDTVHQVGDAVGRMIGVLTAAKNQVAIADRVVHLLPAMLGSDGPRNYLLLFQNNAESRATGGIPGAIALLHADHGRLSLVQQSSAAKFPHYPEPVLPLPVDTLGLYGSITGEYMQDVTLTPRFPVSAALAREMWRREFGTTVDGVISIDPVALSYLLNATGPIALPTGDTLSSGNAVTLLLSEAYSRYRDPAKQDAFFAAAASAVFAHIAHGDFAPKAMIAALAKAGGDRRMLLWSARPEEQARLEQTTLAGMLPSQSEARKTFGVYLAAGTASKMDYYLSAKVGLGQAICRKDGRPTWGVAVTLGNNAPADAATSLPEYVAGTGENGAPKGFARTIVTVYAPPGAIIESATRDGSKLAVLTDKDGRYPVVQYSVNLAPGQTTAVTLRFIGKAPAGTLNAAITPLASPTQISRLAISCE